MKTAILQVADTGPLESLAIMLQSVGYKCYIPSNEIKQRLRDIGCDTVLDIDGLVRQWGYDAPMPLEVAPMSLMNSVDLYADIKAVRTHSKICKEWPNLATRTLWYRINGGEPCHVVKEGFDCGNELAPPCPILTPNLWYRDAPRAYAVWPPFVRMADYFSRYGRDDVIGPPLCLIHNIGGWGYGALIDPIRELGIKIYGRGSPDGLVNHALVPSLLSRAVAMVHLKSSDAPGYALYEAISAGCPIILPKRLIWRNKMADLFESGVTCLTFDRETHDNLSPQEVVSCTKEIKDGLTALKDPVRNREIGNACLERLKSLVWSADNAEDVESLKTWLRRNFECGS